MGTVATWLVLLGMEGQAGAFYDPMPISLLPWSATAIFEMKHFWWFVFVGLVEPISLQGLSD